MHLKINFQKTLAADTRRGISLLYSPAFFFWQLSNEHRGWGATGGTKLSVEKFLKFQLTKPRNRTSGVFDLSVLKMPNLEYMHKRRCHRLFVPALHARRLSSAAESRKHAVGPSVRAYSQ